MKEINSKKYVNIVPVKLIGNKIVKIQDIKPNNQKNNPNASALESIKKEKSIYNIQIENVTEALTEKYLNLLEDIKNNKEIIGTVEEKKGEYPNLAPFSNDKNDNNGYSNLKKQIYISNHKKVLFKKCDSEKLGFRILDSRLYLTIYNKMFQPKKFMNRRQLNCIVRLQRKFKGMFIRQGNQTIDRIKAFSCLLESILLLIERAYNNAKVKLYFLRIKELFFDPYNEVDNELIFEDKIQFKLPTGYYNFSSCKEDNSQKKMKQKL